ncbi:unnamed protein product [Cochlearia groenlandica]
MAIITETSDESNGEDSNKKPQELIKKQNNRSTSSSSSLPIIPNDILEITFAYLSRHLYPKFSLACKPFLSLLTTPYLYNLRSSLHQTEPILYASIATARDSSPSCYILNRNTRLKRLDSLPEIPWGASVITIGHEIFVFGGCIGQERSKKVFCIDCRSHKCVYLPSMRMARCRAAAGVINEKIYIVGGCLEQTQGWLEVFDVKEKTWVRTTWRPKVYDNREFLSCGVMGKKLYTMNVWQTCSYYKPKHNDSRGRHKLLEGDFFDFWWQESSCVIGDMLYTINSSVKGSPIFVYEPEKNKWRYMAGLQGFPREIILEECRMANFGGKLVVLGANVSRFSDYKGKTEIWWVKIGLKTMKSGRIWGNVEDVAVVLTASESPACVELCTSVTL